VRPVVAEGRGWLFTAVGGFELGNAAATLLLLRATEQLTGTLGESGAARTGVLLYAAYNLTATLASFGAGHLIDRGGAPAPARVLAIGAGCLLAVYVGFALPWTTVGALAPPFLLAGIGVGLAEPAQHAAVALTAPED